jgi:hypothetical protein
MPSLSNRTNLLCIPFTQQQSNTTHNLKRHRTTSYNTLLQQQTPTTNMQPFILLTTLAATVSASQILARQATPPAANELKVSLADASQIFSTTFDQSQLPDTSSFDARLVNEVTLTLGSGIVDTALRCQILDSAGEVVRVNRGNNICKSTFSQGDKWTFSAGVAVEVASITCPVAAPADE